VTVHGILSAMKRMFLGALVAMVGFAACGGDESVADAGAPAPAVDAGVPSSDSGASDATLPPGQDAATLDSSAPPVPRTEVAFVGTGDGKIRTYALDSSTGALTLKATLEGAGDPSFLAFDEDARRVFALDESQSRVRAYSLDPKTYVLTALNDVASGGTGPAHIALVRRGKYLLLSHYGSGHLSVIPVASDGKVGVSTDSVVAGEKAHAAYMDPGEKAVFVPCLGSNAVARYRLDDATGKTTSIGAVTMPVAASGPRHLAFAPGSPFVFVLNESKSTLTSFAFDATTSGLTPIETQSTLPANYTDPNTGAEVIAHPAGKFVYTSNRGQDTITRFKYDATGKLTLDGQVSTFGRTPRSFTLAGEGRFAYVANQGSGTVWGYTVDKTTGQMSGIGTVAMAQGLGAPKFVGTARFVDK
jgi:6-phosphogluconolactonase